MRVAVRVSCERLVPVRVRAGRPHHGRDTGAARQDGRRLRPVGPLGRWDRLAAARRGGEDSRPMRHGPMDWTVGTLGTVGIDALDAGDRLADRLDFWDRTTAGRCGRAAGGPGHRRWHGRDVHKSPVRGVVIVAPGNARGRVDDLKSALEGHLNSHSARTY